MVTQINSDINYGMAGNDSTGNPKIAWIHIAFICLTVLAVYSNTFTMDFVWDDFLNIKDNTFIRSLANIPRMFTTDAAFGSATDISASPYYRPLFKISLALDFFLWKEWALGYHLTNTLLHMMVSALVYLFSVKVLRLPGAALIAALVFAVHPVHSEAVAWISARNELICALFMLVSLIFYIRFREKSRIGDMAISLTTFFLSLLAKEMSITLPAIILLLEICCGGEPLRKKIRIPMLFCFATIPYFLLRMKVLAIADWGAFPLTERVYTSFGLITEYLRLLIFPANLKVFYDIPMKSTFFTLKVIIPFLLLIVALVATVFTWKIDRRVFFSLTWVFITLTVVSGIPVVLAPALMAERYLYIPSVGIAMFSGIVSFLIVERMGNAQLFRRLSISFPVRSGNFYVMVWMPILAVLAALNFQRNFTWENNQVFTTRWVQDAPGDSGGHINLGAIHERQGRHDEAAREYRKALSLRPNSLEAHINLGIVYDKTGRVNEAEREYEAALQLDPNFPELYYNLGMLYLRQDRFADAEKAFLRVITLNPGSADAHNNLGLIYSAKGQTSKSVEHLEEAIRLNPDNELYRKNLADVLRDGRKR